MTLHCAKGLEYPVVYIVGMEEGLFPHARSADTLSGIEEERRLFYVGITRAMKQLSLTRAQMRSVYGRMQVADPSRFLDEVPPEVVRSEEGDHARAYAATARRHGERPGFSTQRDQEDGSEMGSLRRRRSAGPTLNRSSRQAANRAGAPHEEPEASGPIVSRGAGPGGEVTVEYDADADPDAFTVDDFRLGMEVLHGKYGRGTIIKKEGQGPGVKLTVSFPGVGRKRLMARYAGLRVAI